MIDSTDSPPPQIVATGATYLSTNPLASGLVRIGEEGIQRENDAAMEAYFSTDFIFHGPGADLNLTQLKEYFAALRNALSGFTITRAQIIGEGNLLGARNIFAGTFTHPFTASPVGTIQPNGRPIRYEVVNTFRYDAEGRLAEEWAQYDNLDLLKQLGVDLLKKH